MPSRRALRARARAAVASDGDAKQQASAGSSTESPTVSDASQTADTAAATGAATVGDSVSASTAASASVSASGTGGADDHADADVGALLRDTTLVSRSGLQRIRKPLDALKRDAPAAARHRAATLARRQYATERDSQQAVCKQRLRAQQLEADTCRGVRARAVQDALLLASAATLREHAKQRAAAAAGEDDGDGDGDAALADGWVAALATSSSGHAGGCLPLEVVRLIQRYAACSPALLMLFAGTAAPPNAGATNVHASSGADTSLRLWQVPPPCALYAAEASRAPPEREAELVRVLNVHQHMRLNTPHLTRLGPISPVLTDAERNADWTLPGIRRAQHFGTRSGGTPMRVLALDSTPPALPNAVRAVVITTQFAIEIWDIPAQPSPTDAVPARAPAPQFVTGCTAVQNASAFALHRTYHPTTGDVEERLVFGTRSGSLLVYPPIHTLVAADQQRAVPAAAAAAAAAAPTVSSARARASTAAPLSPPLLVRSTSEVLQTWAPEAVMLPRGDAGSIIRAVAALADGAHVVTGDDDGNLRLWNCRTGRRAQTATLNRRARRVAADARLTQRRERARARRAAVIAAAAAAAAAVPSAGVDDGANPPDAAVDTSDSEGGDTDEDARDAADEALDACVAVLRGHKSRVMSVCAIPAGTVGGEQVVSSALDGPMFVWSVTRGGGGGAAGLQRVGVWGAGHRDTIRVLQYSPQWRAVISGSADTTLRLHSADSGLEVCAFHLGDAVRDVVELPDGRILALTFGTTVHWVYSRAATAKDPPSARERGSAGVLLEATQRVVWVCHPPTKRCAVLHTALIPKSGVGDALQSLSVLPDWAPASNVMEFVAPGAGADG